MGLNDAKTISVERTTIGRNEDRLLFRDSNGNLIALIVNNATDDLLPYISSDDGEIWVPGDTLFSVDGVPRFGGCIDSTDTIHVVCENPADGNEVIYHQFTIATDGTVTANVTGEIVYSTNDGVQGGAPAVDSSDTIYAIVEAGVKDMGTVYDQVYIFERTGSGSWTQHEQVTTVGTNHNAIGIAMDGNDDVHLLFEDNDDGETMWTKFDVSAGSTVTNEAITSSVFASDILVDPSNNVPVVAIENNIWKRTSGSWSSDSFTSTSPTHVSMTYFGGNLAVIWTEGGTKIFKNENTFGSFSTGDATEMENHQTATLNFPRSDLLGMVFGNKGRTLVLGREADNHTEQYTLESPWDVATATLQNDNLFSGDGVGGAVWKGDGTSFYYQEPNDPPEIKQLDLTTAWDLSTASEVGSFDLSSEMGSDGGYGLESQPDGSHFYAQDVNDGNIYEYSLSTNWDITTASYTGATERYGNLGFAFAEDGLTVISVSGNEVYEDYLGIAYDIDNPLSQETISLPHDLIYGIDLSPREYRMYIGARHDKVVETYRLDEPFQIETYEQITDAVYNGITARWQFNNDNDPSPADRAEVLVNTEDDIHFDVLVEQLPGPVLDANSSAVLKTDADGVIQTIDVV